MDRRLILLFSTFEQAKSALNTINEMAADYWRSQGYLIVYGENGKELVGKINGIDAINATRTITWDEIKESPDGRFYFYSLSNDSRFSEWKETYAQYGGVLYEEIEIPANWIN